MKVARLDGDSLWLWCPGCEKLHRVLVSGATSWTWDGDFENPTIDPSILVRRVHWEPPVTSDNFEQWKSAPWEQHPVEQICHSFMRGGVWQFLSDCTHALAGQAVPAVPVPPKAW